MKHSIVLPIAAIAISLGVSPTAWAKTPGSDADWVQALSQQIGARFEAPSMGYRDAKLTTDVSFDLGRDGAVRNPRISSSSGSPRVDQAVLDAVLSAGPLPPPPTGLQGSKVIFRGSVDASRHFGERR